MRRHNNYDDYDLDPNYDESNVDLDSYEREADYYESECAEGVTVKNYADTNDPVCERLHNWNDCFWFRKYFGMQYSMYYGRSGSVVHICAAFPGFSRKMKGVIEKKIL